MVFKLLLSKAQTYALYAVAMAIIFPAGSIQHRIDFFFYCRDKTCSLSVSLYRDVKHYGQHMHFKSDHVPQLICSKSEIFVSFQRGTGNETVAMATS